MCVGLCNSNMYEIPQMLHGDLEVSREEARQAREQQAAKERSQGERVAQLEDRLGTARQEAESLVSQLSQAKQERVRYQGQATELRTALHTALAQLKVRNRRRKFTCPRFPVHIYLSMQMERMKRWMG